MRYQLRHCPMGSKEPPGQRPTIAIRTRGVLVRSAFGRGSSWLLSIAEVTCYAFDPLNANWAAALLVALSRQWNNVPMTAPARRVSARLAAIAPSATLAVDAKAKALKAAGRPVIGFGA